MTAIDRPAGTAECCNPECHRTCEWSGVEQGRPPRFCSTQCRNAFSKKRARLADELLAYEELQQVGNPGWTDNNEIERRIKTLRMQLERYRPFE